MKWLAFLTILFVLVGAGILWQSSKQTIPTVQKTAPTQPYYKNPYIAQHDTPTQTTTLQPAQQPQRTDIVAPVAQPTRIITPIVGQIDSDPGYDRRTMEHLFFDEVNRQRLIHNLKPLILRKDLSRTARKYSEELAAGAKAETNYDPRTAVVELHHFGASFGLTVVERLNYKGVYDASRAGENILSIPLDISTYINTTLTERSWNSNEKLITNGVRQWMLSPAHRTNILTADYTHGGVGVFRLDNILIVTQIFITEAQCGYYKGPCCESGDACFDSYTCDTSRDEPECRKK